MKKLTDELVDAVREFAGIYGNKWQRYMYEFHHGRVDGRGAHLVSQIRTIRNSHTPNPEKLKHLIGGSK